jgi:hypothetical protein
MYDALVNLPEKIFMSTFSLLKETKASNISILVTHLGKQISLLHTFYKSLLHTLNKGWNDEEVETL